MIRDLCALASISLFIAAVAVWAPALAALTR